MPIVFNEPLSFLQRISEYMEPTYLIHKANSLADSVERMQVSKECVSQSLPPGCIQEGLACQEVHCINMIEHVP